MDKATKFFTNPLVVVIGALLATAFWGSATPIIKLGYEHSLPVRDIPSTILFAGARFFVAGIIVVLIYSILRRRIIYPKPSNIGGIMVVGTFQTILQYVFYYIGLSNTTGVKAAIAMGAQPFFDLIFAALVFRQERFTPRKILAVIIGFSGIVIANLTGLTFDINLMGDGLVMMSAIFYSISIILVKRLSEREDTAVITGYQFLFGGAIMIAIGLLLGGRIVINTPVSAIIFIYLSASVAVAYILWNYLLKYNPVTRVSVFFFMMPAFGVIFSRILLPADSGFDPVKIVTALVLFAVAIIMINYTPKKDRLK